MIGQTLRQFKVLDKIGAGGMGEVYLAQDTQLDRKVALKVVPERTATDALQLQRFKAEARTLASLNHPNIVTIHAVEDVDGTHFLAMELVVGQTLDQVIPEGGLPLSNLLRIALPLVDAIASAHAHGVVHRDLKPRNIMVTAEGRVKVLDFGLATIEAGPMTDVDDSRTAPLTVAHAGTVTGTVPYMAPEQLQAGELGPACDIFALGVLLFEMATGRRPWDGDSPIDLAVSILRDPVPPLPKERHGDELQAVVKRCLAKEPSARYASGRQLHEALCRLENSWMSKTLEDTQILDAVRRAKRLHLGRLTATLAIVLAIVIGVVTLWPRAVGPAEDAVSIAVTGQPRQPMIVVLPFRNLGAPEDRYFAAGISEEVTSRLALVQGLGVISRTSAWNYSDSNKSSRQIGDELGVDYILSGTVRWSQGKDDTADRVRVTPQLVRVADDTQVWSTSYDKILEDSFQVQSELALQVIEQMGINILPREQAAIQQLPTDQPQAAQAFRRGQDLERSPDYTLRSAEEAIREYQMATELDDRFVLAWTSLARLHAQLIHFGHDRGTERHRLATTTLETARRLAPEDPAVLMASGYYHYWVNKDYTAARRDFLRASRRHPGQSSTLAALAYVDRRMGSFQASVRGHEQALTLDPRNATLTREIGHTYLFLGNSPQAFHYLDEAIELSPNSLHTYFTKVIGLWALEGDLRRSREILDSLPPEAHPLRSWCLYWQAIYEGRPDLALDVLRPLQGQVLRWNVHLLPAALLEGEALALMGDDDAAQRAYGEALRILQEDLTEERHDPRYLSALGLTLAGLGQTAQALDAGHRAVQTLPTHRDALFGPPRQIDLAMIYLKVGDTAAAVDEVEIILQRPSQLTPRLLRLDPRWRPLIDEPGFADLMQRI